MAKKITYKVELDVNHEALEDLINKYASKGWILDKIMTHGPSFHVVFRNK